MVDRLCYMQGLCFGVFGKSTVKLNLDDTDIVVDNTGFRNCVYWNAGNSEEYLSHCSIRPVKIEYTNDYTFSINKKN